MPSRNIHFEPNSNLPINPHMICLRIWINPRWEPTLRTVIARRQGKEVADLMSVLLVQRDEAARRD